MLLIELLTMLCNWYRTYIKSIRRDIVIIFMIDLVFLFIMEIGLRQIPAPYPIFVKVGDLFVTLGISFIASFIFYIVQVHLPRIKEKEDLFPYIASMFQSILNTEKDIITQLLGLKMDALNEETIKEKVKGLDLYSEAPLIIGGVDSDQKANLIEYCLYNLKRIDSTWNMLINYSAYLDSECLALLYRIQNSGCFLDRIRFLFPLYKGSCRRLSYKIPESFIKFWHFIEEQQAYYDRTLAKYKTKV